MRFFMFTHDQLPFAPRRPEEELTRRLWADDERVCGWLRWVLAVAMVALSHAAQAHGIVGNRVFPGTLALDDPAVMDELIFPAATTLKHPGDGADVTDDRIGGSFTRLLTSTLSLGIEGGWIHRNWGVSQRSGFDTTALTLKDLLYKNELHEVMISAGLAWGIGHSGAQGRTPANSAPCSRAMSTRCTGDSRSSTACSISPTAIRPASFPRMNQCISSSPSLNLRSIRRAEKKPLPR